jgi:hypothetical protein
MALGVAKGKGHPTISKTSIAVGADIRVAGGSGDELVIGFRTRPLHWRWHLQMRPLGWPSVVSKVVRRLTSLPFGRCSASRSYGSCHRSLLDLSYRDRSRGREFGQ